MPKKELQKTALLTPKFVTTNLRWPGGKSKMTRILQAFMPENIDKYFEVFTGGASVLLFVLQKYNPEITLANDIDQNLIRYYQHLQIHPKTLVGDLLRIKNAFDSEQFRNEFKKLDTQYPEQFFVANKTSFSGLNYNYSKLAYEKNFTHRSIEKIIKLSDLLRDVDFINVDFRRFDRKLKDYFIYLDPPYFSNAQKGLYGKKGTLHKSFDHDALKLFVDRYASDNKIMISYDDCSDIRQMYSQYHQYNFDFVYSMTNTGGNNCKTGKEIVITNYKVKR